jgi:hypothetical protein
VRRRVPTVHEGACAHSGAVFRFELVHSGLNGSAFAYCGDCGCTALLDGRKPGSPVALHGPITGDAEALLAACACGGGFAGNHAPRCPHCRGTLDAKSATGYIEAAIQPVAAGWKWQGDWHGLYCMIVEKRFAVDPWNEDG